MQIRDFRFELDESKIFTYGKYKPTTRLLNALSLLFPKGERYFVESLKWYEQVVTDEKTLNEMKIFYRQEYQHAREHKKLNDIFKKHGLDVDALDKQILARLNKYGSNQEKALLVTVCLERLTELGGYLLPKIADLILEDNEYKKMWLWHAMEEVEHAYISEEIYAKYTNMPKYYEYYYMLLTFRELTKQVIINYKELKKIDD